MTGIKVAVSTVGMVLGSATSITGAIMANVPAIGGDTPVNLTLALVAGGLMTTAALAWKVSRSWYMMEAKVLALETEVASLRKSRSAGIAAKLRAYEAQLEAEAAASRDT